MTSSVIAARSDKKSAPSQIKESYIADSQMKKRKNLIGIQAFRSGGDAEEIQSPMKLKKKELGQLNLSDSIQKTKPDDDKKERFDKFDKQFSVVQTNFTAYKKRFDELKAMSTVNLADLNS